MNKLKAFQIKSIKHLENSILEILKISLNEIASAEFIFVLATTDFKIAVLQLEPSLRNKSQKSSL